MGQQGGLSSWREGRRGGSKGGRALRGLLGPEPVRSCRPLPGLWKQGSDVVQFMFFIIVNLDIITKGHGWEMWEMK